MQHIVRNSLRFRLFILIAGMMSITVWSEVLQARAPWILPLANLSIVNSPETGQLDGIRITYPDSKIPRIITFRDDYCVEYNGQVKETHLFEEPGFKANLISDFEAENLLKVTETMVRTLDIFDGDLQGGRWNRCLYLDAYFPRFLKGYFYLYCAAYNTLNALPSVALPPDSLFEVSEKSALSDERISRWRDDAETRVLLRIMIKELIYQARRWEKAELQNRSKKTEVTDAAEKYAEAYAIFIKLYFHIQPPKRLPFKGKHL